MTDALTITRIDPRIVKQVGWNVARGMTLEQCLILLSPPIPVDAFNTYLNNDPRLMLIFKRAQAEYVDKALEFIEQADAKEIQGQKWILERTHPQFGRRPETVNQVNIINGITPEVLEKIRAAARKNPVVDVETVK